VRALAARRLVKFPLLRAAYDQRLLGLEPVLLILRILGPGAVEPRVERAWIEHARTIGIRRLRDEARALQHQWIVTGHDAPPMPLDDQTWLESLEMSPGTTRRRFDALLALDDPEGGEVPWFRFELRLSDDLIDDFLGAIEDRRLRLPTADLPVPIANHLAQTFSARGRENPTWLGLLALLEEYVVTWDLPDNTRKRREQQVHAVHGYRCAVPGCTSRSRLHGHHVELLSQGGSDDPSNKVSLCEFHHQQGMHGLLAACRGRAPLDLVFRVGLVRLARWFRNDRRIQPSAAG
jgi:hypothetical protein